MRPVVVTNPEHGRLLIDRRARTVTTLTTDPPHGAIIRTPSKGIIKVSYDLTYKCPLACLHCLSDDKRPSHPDPISIIDRIEATGAIWLHMTGGEPLAHPKFQEIYTHAWNAGLCIVLLTNGILLKKYASLLNDKPPHRISISLYGATPETHDAMTRQPGSLSAMLASIKTIQGANIRVKGIITRLNQHEASDMQHIGESLGTYHEFRNIMPTVLGDPSPLALRTSDPPRSKPWTGCNAGKTTMHIQADGSITPCRACRGQIESNDWNDLPHLAQVALSWPTKPPYCPPVYRAKTRQGVSPCATMYVA
jgi:MoaA/NifB/PqqE/SkfB family radical SAM enzyme